MVQEQLKLKIEQQGKVIFLSHDELLLVARILAKDLGYEDNLNAINGHCYGSCGLAMDHILTGQIFEFNEQSRWVKELIDNRHILQDIRSISEEEKIKLLEIFRSVMLNHNPRAFEKSHKLGRMPYIQELAETMPFVQSKALSDLGSVYKVTAFTGLYNLDTDIDLFNYLTSLKKSVAKVDVSFSLLLQNGSHVILMGYNAFNTSVQMKSWFFYDINQGNYLYSMDMNEIETFILFLQTGLFLSSTKENYAINTHFYCLEHNKGSATELSKNFLLNLKDAGLNEVTLEKANQEFASNHSGLHAAANIGDTDTLRSIISLSTAHINLRNDGGWSPLMLATANGKVQVVELLLQAGCNINLQNWDGCSALMLAAQYGNFEIVDLLIQKNAHINIQSYSGNSALILSAKNGYFDIVNLLIKRKAKLTLKTQPGLSALMLAALHGHFEIVHLLIQSGAEVNLQCADETSACMFSALNGHTKIVELLIQNGANINLLNTFGFSAFTLAAQNEHIDVMCMLMKNANMSWSEEYASSLKSKWNGQYDSLMEKDLLNFEDKINLIKLYILLRTYDEARRRSFITRGLTYFFKPECTYQKKIETAQALLTALENNTPIPAGITALRDGNLKAIAARCFPDIAVGSHSNAFLSLK
ncbi:MAG: ankyrin repeat protein 29-like [Gammaproteobacteria bacterium]|nr:ankyrin repeat protein 29-like [Gammaproteobacteria bacterium]